MGQIDLHIHTTASDGTDSPAQVVRTAHALGLVAIAITDHDNASGVPEALAEGARLGLEVIPGVELSTDYRGNKAHMLGYYVDAASPALAPALDWAVTEREERNEKIVGLLARDGFDISLKALREEYPGAVLGRPHMAEHLMKGGYVSSVQEAFDRLLAEGCPYYVPKGRLSMARAVACIRGAGGVAVLAHPLEYGYQPEALAEFVDQAVACGVCGLEAIYSAHTPQEEALMRRMAEERGLLITGGSDYHGARKPGLRMGCGFGAMYADASLLPALRAAAGREIGEKGRML